MQPSMASLPLSQPSLHRTNTKPRHSSRRLLSCRRPFVEVANKFLLSLLILSGERISNSQSKGTKKGKQRNEVSCEVKSHQQLSLKLPEQEAGVPHFPHSPVVPFPLLIHPAPIESEGPDEDRRKMPLFSHLQSDTAEASPTRHEQE